MECGINAGVTPIYVLTGHGHGHKDELALNVRIFNNLFEASKHIISKI